ncbi:MAG TPA: BamA/TamA family outer membrane protein [Kofleriaceae bacterium]|nr:BamA/TamA family outer membrane protein [Kofleriaceae bacterium]
MSGSRSVALTAVVAIVAACGGGQKTVRRPGEEYLAEIRIEANKKALDFNPKNIIPGLALNRAKGKRALDEYQLNLDVTRIEGTFQKHGYFAAKVTPRVERKGDKQIAIFHVDEGPQAKAKVDIIGLPPEVPLAEARALVPVKDGAAFSYDAFDGAKTPMLALVENAGYAHAVMQAAVLADKAANTATLQYAFDPGPRTTFGAIEIVGVDGVLADAARARLTFKPGDGYSTKALAQSQEAIYGIGMFSAVRVDADRTTLDASVPVRIQLTEALHWEARGGIGAGIDILSYNVRLRGSLSHTGWPTPLSTLSLEARPALVVLRDHCPVLGLVGFDECKMSDSDDSFPLEPRIRVLGSAVQQDFLRPGVKGELQGGYDYVTLEGFVEYGPLVRLGISSPLGTPRLQGHLGWQFANYTFGNLVPPLDPTPDAGATEVAYDPTRAESLGLLEDERLGAFTQALELDLRDNPVEPTVGGYAQIKVSEGTVAAGGAFNYLQLIPELRGYYSLGGAVFAAHARFGAILGDVPPTERFYAGGAASQRGFADRRLSPEVIAVERDPATGVVGTNITSSVVVGGAGLFETGIEVRRHWEPLGIKAGWVVFLDGGDVTSKPADLDLTHLHWAVGAGLRFFYLPIGPIRLEVARRINRTGGNEPSRGQLFNFILSVGEAF